jgi:hypothetical protein
MEDQNRFRPWHGTVRTAHWAGHAVVLSEARRSDFLRARCLPWFYAEMPAVMACLSGNKLWDRWIADKGQEADGLAMGLRRRSAAVHEMYLVVQIRQGSTLRSNRHKRAAALLASAFFFGG